MFTLKKHRVTSSPSSSSITSISDLDDDTLVEIISRFPIKCMVSSMSVSKLWYRLISTVCIPKITSCAVSALLFNPCTVSPAKVRGPWSFAWINSPNWIPSLLELSHILPFTPSPYEFLDCSNGFFLFFDRSSRQYYVCNPSTEQYLAIPNSPQNNIPICGGLIFDPHCKVVHIPQLDNPFTMNIFSTETSEWAVYNFHLEPSILDSNLVARHIFLDGSLYMLSLSGYLLRFDMKHICVQAIKLPEIVVRDNPIGCIGMSQGRLHYAWDDDKSQMMVWILGEGRHTDEWVLKHTICHQYFLDHPLCRNLQDSSLFSIYAFDPTSDVLFVGNWTGIYRYDPYTKRLESLCRLKSGTFISAGQYCVFPFSPNLTTLDAFNQSICKDSAGRDCAAVDV